MKKHIKKLISSLMAISLAAPIFSGIPVFAENSDGTIVDQTQALTVVGKRIKGDDTYFEISLEVNDDYDKYSSVGVVLRYDPDYIIPAESWDEGAGAADMSENTTWATRRALPTLGLETWSTHTALAYQEDTAATGSGGKKYGYLYLGAEHPLTVEGTSDSPASPDSSESDPAAPAAEPEASPEPGTRPVVVARFMYKTTAGDSAAVPPVTEVTGAAVKAKLVDDWINGTNNSGAVQSKGTNWDYDWTANKILTIASDEVAGKSPAQYPFAIYTQDYEEKAFMRTWPAVTPTVTPAPGDPTPTPMPISAYAPEIGAGVDPANHLTRNDIMIITCEGESAKAQGGLKLSDIYTILFFDWDDSLIGALTAGQGEPDMNKTVSEYVKAKMVHPDLQGNTNYSSLDRIDTYRGEYPDTAPDSSNPTARTGAYGEGSTEPGSKYPVTNKLEYVFAGKEFYNDAPYAGGWTQVTADNMSTTYTWFRKNEMEAGIYGKAVDIDQVTGYALDASGVPDASIPIPEMVSCDFDSVKLPSGETTLLVKAVYWPGTMINDGTANYTTDDANAKIELVGDLSNANNRNYAITFDMFRINKFGYGVARPKEAKIKMGLTQVGASGETVIQVDVKNQETIPVTLIPSNHVAKTNYQLVDIYGYNIVTATTNSDKGKTFELLGDNGFKLPLEYNYFLDEIYNKGTSTITYTDFIALGFNFAWTKATAKKPQGTVTPFKTAANGNNAIKYIGYYLDEAKSRGDINGPEDLTWAMLQYAIINCTTAKKAASNYKTAAECEGMFVIDNSQDYTYYAANHYYMEKPNYSWMK